MEDPTGIEEEAEASQQVLESLILPYSWLEEDSGRAVLISGIALTEGVWKNVIYSAEELRKYALTLKGKPVLVEHGKTREFEDRSVGEVVDSYFEETLKGVVFKALITDPLAKRLVKKEILPAISCSTWMEKKPVNEKIKLGSKYEFAEMSLVRTPACDRCFIFHKEQLSLLEKDFNSLQEKLKEGEDNLEIEEEEIESLSEIEEEEEELIGMEELEEPKLYAVIELTDEEALEGLRKAKKVVSYYYGYYPYMPYQPYYHYPHPCKYPYRYPKVKKKLSEESPVLLAVVELTGREEIEELRKAFKVKKIYYGYYGYPYYPYYPYAYYPYKYKYKYHYPKYPHYPGKKGKKKLSEEEELATQKRTAGEPLPEYKEFVPEELPNVDVAFTPNPEACAELVCPVCDLGFPDEEKFLEHWDQEHKEKYGDFKATAVLLDALAGLVDLAKGDTKIIKTRAGRYILLVDTGREGLGKLKILGNFATLEEAEEAIEKVKKGKYPCPACLEEFEAEEDLVDHWRVEHLEKYGRLKKGYLYPKKAYYYCKYRGRYYPYYYRKGKYFKKYKCPGPVGNQG